MTWPSYDDEESRQHRLARGPASDDKCEREREQFWKQILPGGGWIGVFVAQDDDGPASIVREPVLAWALYDDCPVCVGHPSSNVIPLFFASAIASNAESYAESEDLGFLGLERPGNRPSSDADWLATELARHKLARMAEHRAAMAAWVAERRENTP